MTNDPLVIWWKLMIDLRTIMLEIGTFGELLFVFRARHAQLPWTCDQGTPHVVSDCHAGRLCPLVLGGRVTQSPTCR
jgi:hypothetical protein